MNLRHSLLTTMIALMWLIIGIQVISAQDGSTANPLINPDYSTNAAGGGQTTGEQMEQEVITLTNQLRSNLGLGAVSSNNCLILAGRRHGQDMGNRNYFSHKALVPAPHGVNFWERSEAAGYTGFASGENIAAGYNSASAVFEGWRTSPGHYAIMTQSGANEIGVGYVYVPGSAFGHYWVMVLGSSQGGSCVKTHLATNLAVSGNTTDHPARPTFNWQHNPTPDNDHSVAEWYQVYVTRNGSKVLGKWLEASVVCPANACSWTPDDVDLPNGLSQNNYDFYVASWSSSGGTQWTQAYPFSINSGPGLVSLTSPANSAQVTTAVVNLQWASDAKATWYRVYVLGPNNYSFNQWVKSADVCTSGCSLKIAPLYEGSYTWWMTAWGPGGFSIGGDYNGYSMRTFTLNTSAPGAVSGLSFTNSPLLTMKAQWNENPNASWYQVQFLDPQNNDAVVYDKWVQATERCPGGNCFVNDFNLSNGSYKLRVRAWGPAGMGTWTPIDAQISFGLPGQITGQQPAHNSSTAAGDIILNWSADANSSWYQVVLTKSGVNVLSQWYAARDICNTRCYAPALNLTPGTYSWSIKGWGPGGMGSPIVTSFTLF